MKMIANLKQKATLATVLMASIGAAHAGNGGTEFNNLSTMLRNWSEGGLGLALALAAFIIGLAVGLVKQTVMPAIVGIGVALFASMGPGIIAAMFTATV